jgi:short-subunit dehydrogenase
MAVIKIRGTSTILVAILALFLYWLLCPLPSFPIDPALTVAGKRVLITGASQGIGRSLAEEYAKRGASHISIASRSRAKLEVVRDRIRATHPEVKVSIFEANLSTEEQCRGLIQESLVAMGGIDVLLLNHITYSRFGSWLGDAISTSEGHSFVPEMFAVNTWSYIWLATYAMDALKASSGRIGVVSSLAAHVGTPKSAVYSATKHALHGFFNALRLELRLENIDNVSITLCAIGATDTEGAAAVKDKMNPALKWDPPSKAAEAILRGVASRRREIFHPHHLVFPAILLHTIAPDLLDYVLLETVKSPSASAAKH